MKTEPATDLLARDYFSEVIRGEDAATGAFDRLVTLIEHEPVAAWDVVNQLVLQSTSDIELAHVGTGPLEDILIAHPEIYVPRAVAAAERDPKMRRALAFAVVSEDDMATTYLSLLNSARESSKRR